MSDPSYTKPPADHVWRRPFKRQSKPGDAPTPRQAQVMAFIQSFCMANRLPPTLREIGAALDIASTNGVMSHIRAMEKKGLIRKVGGRYGASRGYVPASKDCPYCDGGGAHPIDERTVIALRKALTDQDWRAIRYPTVEAMLDAILSPPPTTHAHGRECYDDPGPGHGSPVLICEPGGTEVGR